MCIRYHGVDNDTALLPEGLDCGKLLCVLLTLVVANQIVIVSHGKFEVVGIDEEAVH